MSTQSLDELSREFARWRAQKPSRYERVPAELRARALSFVTEFSENEIARASGLSRRNLFPRAEKVSKGSTQFIELAGAVVPGIEIEIRSSKQVIVLRVPGPTPLSTLIPLLKS
jgi:hypothetical protein